MSKKNKKKSEGDIIPPKEKDGKLKEKIRRHISDINDVITDEDMRNIDTSTNIITPIDQEEVREVLPELKEKQDNDDNSLKAWDVLEDGKK